MGWLTGKYTPATRPPADDVRRDTPGWDYFDDGGMEGWLARLGVGAAELTADGRTLGWVWGRSEVTIPIPGFRTVGQLEAGARAAARGPLALTATS